MSDFRDLSPSIGEGGGVLVGCLGGLIPSLDAVPGTAVEAGFRHALEAGLTDRLAAALMFVVRGEVADALVEPDQIVGVLHGVQLGTEHRGSVIVSRCGYSALMSCGREILEAAGPPPHRSRCEKSSRPDG